MIGFIARIIRKKWQSVGLVVYAFLTLLRSEDDSNVEGVDDVSDDDMLHVVSWGGLTSALALEGCICSFNSSPLKPESLMGHRNVLLEDLYATESLLLMLEHDGGTDPQLCRL